MKRLALALALLLSALGASAQSYSGASLGGPVSGGSAVAAHFTCRTFAGVEASEGGSLTLFYGQALTCWATDSTVSGAQVNVAGFVADAFFKWTWGDDNGLGTVSTGGATRNLGVAYGVVAATAFKPTTYGESCASGSDNSLQTISLEVGAGVTGSRQSATASLTVCVVKREVKWTAPVAYCDDSDCTNDAGVPAGAVHGGNLTDLATILNSCDSASKWIVLEGGVTFSTASTGITMGANACLVESYGTGKAKIKFTSTGGTSDGIAVSDAACAGVVLNNLTLAGSGTGPRFINGAGDTGCFAVEDSVTANGSESFSAALIADPNSPTANSSIRHGYFVKTTWNQTPGGGLAPVFFYCDWCGFVGGEISGVNGHVSAEQNLRSAQETYLVIDAMTFKDSQYCRQGTGSGLATCSQENGQAAKSTIELRQDCGTSVADAACTHSAQQGPFAVTRTYIESYSNGVNGNGTGLPGGGNFSSSYPIQLGTSGTGGNEPTKNYDGDFIGNLITFTDDFTQNNQCIQVTGGGISGTETKRMRFWFNACDLSSIDSSTSDRMFTITAGGASNFVAIGNVIVATKNHSRTYSIAGGSTIWDVVANNVGFENGAASSLDLFPSYAEDTTNNKAVSSGTSPFTVTPGQFTAFGFDDLVPQSGGVLHNLSNYVDGAGVDVDGDARCQGTACEPGVHEIN